jgi:hypothetical protein
MKNTSSTLFCFLLFGLIILGAGCGENAGKKAVEADSIAVENNEEVEESENLVLIPGALKIGIPEGVNEKERNKGASEDSIFYELEMGVNPMDLEFGMLQNTDENLSLEQMEEQRLFVDDGGKTFEHESGKIYRSEWYTLTYAMENKFRLTSFKQESDYSALVDYKKENIKLKENQTLSSYITRYYLRFSTSESGKPRVFVLVLNLTVGC